MFFKKSGFLDHVFFKSVCITSDHLIFSVFFENFHLCTSRSISLTHMRVVDLPTWPSR